MEAVVAGIWVVQLGIGAEVTGACGEGLDAAGFHAALGERVGDGGHGASIVGVGERADLVAAVGPEDAVHEVHLAAVGEGDAALVAEEVPAFVFVDGDAVEDDLRALGERGAAAGPSVVLGEDAVFHGEDVGGFAVGVDGSAEGGRVAAGRACAVATDDAVFYRGGGAAVDTAAVVVEPVGGGLRTSCAAGDGEAVDEGALACDFDDGFAFHAAQGGLGFAGLGDELYGFTDDGDGAIIAARLDHDGAAGARGVHRFLQGGEGFHECAVACGVAAGGGDPEDGELGLDNLEDDLDLAPTAAGAGSDDEGVGACGGGCAGDFAGGGVDREPSGFVAGDGPSVTAATSIGGEAEVKAAAFCAGGDVSIDGDLDFAHEGEAVFRAGGDAEDIAGSRRRRDIVGVEAPVHDGVVGLEGE